MDVSDFFKANQQGEPVAIGVGKYTIESAKLEGGGGGT